MAITTLRTITQPAEEPITLVDAKQHARIYSTWEDTILSGMLTSARQTIEQWLSRVCVTQVLLQTVKFTGNQNLPYSGNAISGLGGFWSNYQDYGLGSFSSLHQGAIELARCPVQSVDVVTLRDRHGTDLVIDNTVYNLDLEFDPARLRIRWDEVNELPTPPLYPLQHIQIQFHAGYMGTEYNEPIPQPILNAILLLMTFLYRNRGDANMALDIPSYIYDLIANYKVWFAPGGGGPNG